VVEWIAETGRPADENSHAPEGLFVDDCMPYARFQNWFHGLGLAAWLSRSQKRSGMANLQILGALRGDSPAERGGSHEVGPRGKTFPRPRFLPERWMGLSQNFMFLLGFLTGWDGLRLNLNGFPVLLGEASRRNMLLLDGRHPRRAHGGGPGVAR
jgi:hypothetical protein